MKTIKNILAITAVSIIFCLQLATAQIPPPPNNGSDPGGGNTPVGGGAPIGSGVALLLGMGAAYYGKKLYHLKKDIQK